MAALPRASAEVVLPLSAMLPAFSGTAPASVMPAAVVALALTVALLVCTFDTPTLAPWVASPVTVALLAARFAEASARVLLFDTVAAPLDSPAVPATARSSL